MNFAAFLEMLLRLYTLPAWLTLCAIVSISTESRAARVGLIVGEPFGSFGAMMPQGHASVYLADWCADTPLHLRPCAAGETGAVVSRYHDLRHPELDWMAVPAETFFYGTENVADVPAWITAKHEAEVRESYRQAHLLAIVPDRADRHGRLHTPAYGDWMEGIGAAFDRRLLLYTFEVPAALEAAMATRLNGEPNERRYTLARENCADFAAELLGMVLPPHTFPRNVWADFDMTTPKSLARDLDGYGHTHPAVDLQVFSVAQIPGTLRRSRPLMGAAEMFVREKRYALALLVLQPELLPVLYTVYRERGKWPYGSDAIPLAPDEFARFVKPSADRPPVPLLPEPPRTESASAQSNTN